MAVRKIVYDTDSLIRKQSKEVTEFDERLHQILDDMWDTVIKAQGAGLAGVQVGILRRIFIVMTDTLEKEFINPVILEKRGSQKGAEGCLSVPRRQGEVERPNFVKIKAQDRFGKEFTITAKGFDARAICHEYDHLDGKLYIDIAADVYNI